MDEKITSISGDRHQVADRVYEMFMGDLTPEEFMTGSDNIEDAIKSFVEQLDGPEPVFYWREMCSEYTLTELLTRYLEDHEDEINAN